MRAAELHLSDSASPALMMSRSGIHVRHVWVELRLICMQVRLFMSGAETVLTDAANPEELFATADFETRWAIPHTLSTLQPHAAAGRQPHPDAVV